MTTTLSERISQSAFDGSRLRVVLLLDTYDGAQKEFLEAYEHLRNQVASVPGHISDQLCQSIENPSQWLITSEWESAPPFLAWVNSEEHVATVQPLHNCVRDTRSLRFSVLRETGKSFEMAPETAKGRLQASPRVGDGVVRHALTFTVKPGTEDIVAKILADYDSPNARVDDDTRLRRTSLFMHGNRVVRAVEVEGDLLAALRHVARQPEVRAVEEAINPYLEQDRDLSDPDSARMFFTRAALPTVHHVTAGRRQGRGHPPATRSSTRPRRAAAWHSPGCSLYHDEEAADDPASIIDSSTIFQRDDVVVRLLEAIEPIDAQAAQAVGIDGPGKVARLGRLLDGGANAVPANDQGISRFLAEAEMTLITDRRAMES